MQDRTLPATPSDPGASRSAGPGSAVAIRPAEAGDEAAIWAILEPIFRAGETYAVDRAIERHDALAYWRTGACFVASLAAADAGTAPGSICGTYYLRRNFGGGGAHVCNCGFAVSTTARGRGLARAMLTHALAAARVSGYRAMQFNAVVATNTGAIALWREAGFATIGRVPEGFDHPRHGFVDLLVMHRPLV